MADLWKSLEQEDLRSLGNTAQVVQYVLAHPSFFPVLLEGVFSSKPVVQSRAADAVEKITRSHFEYLTPFKTRLLHLMKCCTLLEVRWHLAQLAVRLQLTAVEKKDVILYLWRWLHSDTSSIVRTFALQALADFAQTDRALRKKVLVELEDVFAHGTPAMRSRAKQLLKQLG